ncbi:MAG TPA: KH domain-containing protein [Acidimicrobiia bacterium]|nr:KH domain-containing protein [Acidimicrobiia bacterium]
MSDHDDFDDDHDDDFDDEVAPDGNRVVGATARGVLEYIAKNLVDDPESVFVDAKEGGREVTFHVHVAPDDMGRLIGKRGRVAHAIRAVVAAAAHRDGVKAGVEFVD